MDGERGIALHGVAHGRAAVEALRRLLTVCKASDPLAPVTVVVPTKVTGLALRRALAAGAAGLVGVRFVVLAQLAELLAARALSRQGLAPLTDPVRREHVRLALAQSPGALASVADHPATQRVVERAAAELRRATAAGGEQAVLSVLDAGPALARTLATVHRTLRAGMGAANYDESDLALTAADVVRRDPGALREVGPTLVYLPRALDPAEVALVRALGGGGRVDVLVGLTGDRQGDEPAGRLARALTGRPAPAGGPPAPPAPSSVRSAPDADEEVRGVVREIARLLAEGRPLARIAVLYGDPQPYATLAAEHLAAAGLPANGPVARTLGQTLPGRVLLDALALPDADHARGAVLDWLALAPPRPGDPVSVDRWAAVADAARIGRGRDQWGRRLRAHLARAGSARVDVARTSGLLDFAEALFADLDGPADRSWRGFAGWALGLLDRWLGPPTARWPEEDRRAEPVLRERLAALATLDAAGAPAVDLAGFRRVLAAELEQPAGRLGQFGVGAYLGPLATAAALDFDRVFVLGLAEGAFPTRPRESSLLPEHVRARLRAQLPNLPAALALPTREERVTAERAALCAVLSSGAETTLSYPRSDRRQQRERMPSPWLLELAGRRAGASRALVADELAAATGWHADVASVHAGIEDAAEPATESEWIARELLGVLRQGDDVAATALVGGLPDLARSLQVARTRAGDAFSAWDGLVGPHPWLDGVLAAPHAPTTLARYDVCPRQYLLRTVLGVRGREQRDDPLALEGAYRGELLHRILEDVLDAYVADPPPTVEAARAVLQRVTDRQLASGGDDSLGRRLAADLVRIWLGRWLDEHLALAADLGVAPVGAELPFGTDADPLGPLRVELPGGRELAFSGRIDRLDASPDGRVALVVDYKSSSDDGYRGVESDPVLAGRELQLAVYALAAAVRYPDATVEARYWFIGPRTTRAAMRGFSLGPIERARTLEVLDVLADGIGTGAFPARPGEWNEFRKTHAHCRSCAFDRICPSPGARERAWERKSQAPVLARYRDLVES